MTQQEYNEWCHRYARELDADKRLAMLMTALETPNEYDAEFALRRDLWIVRYGAIDRTCPDGYIRFWMDALYARRGAGGLFGKRQVTKTMQHGLTQLGLAQAGAGERAARILREELEQMMRLYLTTCTKDSKYGSQAFGLMQMKEDALVQKIAAEIESVTAGLPELAHLVTEYASLRESAHRIFDEFFPGCSLSEEEG